MNNVNYKKIRVASDIHNDFDAAREKRPNTALWYPDHMEDDQYTIFAIPGDLWTSGRVLSYAGHSWLGEVSKRFAAVVFVLGNHDFFGGLITSEYQKLKAQIVEQGLSDKVFLLQNESLVLGNYKFVGATLWTDFGNGDKEVLRDASNMMRDYAKIRHGIRYRKITPEIIFDAHTESRNFLIENAIKDFEEQKLVVITHHAPSFKSISPKWKSQKQSDSILIKNLSAMYASDLDSFIKKSKIDYWLHGHCHNASNYLLGNTRVVCNPRGYPEEDTGFNTWLEIA